MGWVFLAADTRNQALVALKLLPPQRARTEERTLARFQREMELSQKVAHPHVAWTYEVGEHRASTTSPWSTSRARPCRGWWPTRGRSP